MANKKIKVIFTVVLATFLCIGAIKAAPTTLNGTKGLFYGYDDTTNKWTPTEDNLVVGGPTTSNGTKILMYGIDSATGKWTAMSNVISGGSGSGLTDINSSQLGQLSDVNTTTLSVDDGIKWDGSEWVTAAYGGASAYSSNWEELYAGTLTPTSTSAGLFVYASSTFDNDLRVNGMLRATSSLDFWLNASSTIVTENDFSGLADTWESTQNRWATDTEQYFWNNTTTWAGFSSEWNKYTNASSTILTENDLTAEGFITDLSGFTTANLSENTNLYYTDARVRDYIQASTTIQTHFTNADEAQSWGDHALAGYGTSNWATSDTQSFWNSTSTWAGFQDEWNKYTNASSTIVTEADNTSFWDSNFATYWTNAENASSTTFSTSDNSAYWTANFTNSFNTALNATNTLDLDSLVVGNATSTHWATAGGNSDQWNAAYAGIHDAVTLAGEDFLTLSGQQITAVEINPDNLANADFGDFSCNGTACNLDANTVTSDELNMTATYVWTGPHTFTVINATTSNADVLTANTSSSLANATSTHFAVSTLASCNTIDTTADGTFICGTDEGGSGGLTDINSSQLGQLSDVNTTTLAAWDILNWDGDSWDNLATTTFLMDYEIDAFSELQSLVSDATILSSGGTLSNTNLCVADGTSGAIDCNVANNSGNWDTAYSSIWAESDEQAFWNGTSTWAGFQSEWNKYTNASSTIITLADLTAEGYLTSADIDTFSELDTIVADQTLCYAGGAFHDGFSDFVANEHIDWTIDQGATNINAGNYTDTNTTYTAGTNITLVSTTFNVDDAFVINSGNDTMTGVLTADGLTLGANENITLGAQTLDHNGTDFVFSDSLQIGGGATSTRLDVTDTTHGMRVIPGATTTLEFY